MDAVNATSDFLHAFYVAEIHHAVFHNWLHLDILMAIFKIKEQM